MILTLSLLSACGSLPPTPPPEFQVEIVDPTGGQHTIEGAWVHVDLPSGNDCVSSTWMGRTTDSEGLDVAAFTLIGWSGPEVELNDNQTSLFWDWEHDARLAGGVATILDDSDERFEAQVEGGQVCSRIDGQHEETCEPQTMPAGVVITGPITESAVEREGRAGYGIDVATGEPVCVY